MTFTDIAHFLSRHRELIWEMAKREVSDRYAGQALGVVWAIGHPLVLVAVYLFIFGYVFKTNIGGTRDMPLDYTVYLLSGVIPWITLQEVLMKTTVTITSHASLVKQAIFPTEVLPLKSVVASFFSQLVATALLIIYVLATHHRLPWTYALLPALMALQMLCMLGLGCALSALGVFMRDLKDVVQVLTIIGVYLLPVLYLPAMVPQLFRPLLYFNPFSYLVWCYQDACYFGRFEHPFAWAVFFAFSIATLYGGFGIFHRLKLVFANVL